MRALQFSILILLVAATQTASAQPSMTPRGAPGSYAPQHAVPPLPVQVGSPMQSIPPPQNVVAEEPDDPAAGSTIKRSGYTAYIHQDGSMLFDADFLKTSLSPTTGPSATFDIGDSIMRSFGKDGSNDPYYSDKIAMLNATFERRIAMRTANNKLLMDRAIVNLPRFLAEIWNEPGLSSELKRQILFALWDEVAEGGNEYLREGGKRARATIERFIRSNLPVGHPAAYSQRELRRLNDIRSSRAAFAPYRAGPAVFAPGSASGN
jgi:hypothetical protein